MKYISLILLVVTLAFASFGQEVLNVDVTKLSQQELLVYQKIKQQTQAASQTMSLDNLTPAKIDQYAQIGKAFGTAFKECWTTVSTDAERFANSSAGKWAMVMVTWKIMGNDAMTVVSRTVRFAVGIGLLMVGVPFFIYIFRRNCVETPLLKSKTSIAFLTIKKEYDGTNKPIHNDMGPWGYAVVFGIYVFVCSAIMFF